MNRLAEHQLLRAALESDASWRVVAQAMKALARLAEANDQLANIFGARGHEFLLEPTLPVGALERFEREHGIELPADYREFLTAFGDGGPGPGYRILPLRHWNEGHTTFGADFLRTPFRHTEAWNDGRVFVPRQDYFVDFSSDIARASYFSSIERTGTISIAELGCGDCAFLVVTGTERGNVWIDERGNGGGVFPVPCPREHPRHAFRQWYTEWLQLCVEAANQVTAER